MALGSWDPTAPAQVELDPKVLARLIAYSTQDQLDTLNEIVADQDSQTLSGLMKVEHSIWRSVAETLSDDDIFHLIRFLAVAENLPGWEALEKSPVIPLAKVLRKRGGRLDKAFLQWLRKINNNRFLPYGPL